MAQWLRICPPMQGTRVQSLVGEDPTCCGTTKPNAPQLLSLRSRAREPQLLKPACLEPVPREATAMRSPRTATKSSPPLPQLEKAHTHNKDLTQPKINKIFKNKIK